MCIECVPPQLVDITPHDHDRFFRMVSGRRCNNLNHRYVMPADEDELRVRAALFALRGPDDGVWYLSSIRPRDVALSIAALRAASQDDPIRVRE